MKKILAGCILTLTLSGCSNDDPTTAEYYIDVIEEMKVEFCAMEGDFIGSDKFKALEDKLDKGATMLTESETTKLEQNADTDFYFGMESYKCD